MRSTPRAESRTGANRERQTTAPLLRDRPPGHRVTQWAPVRRSPSRPILEERVQCVQRIRLRHGLVLPPPQNSREAHGDSGLVPRRRLAPLDGELEYVHGSNVTHRPELLDLSAPNPAIERPDFDI